MRTTRAEHALYMDTAVSARKSWFMADCKSCILLKHENV